MHQQGKGKANKISGIPLPNSLSQTDESSVEPNRKEMINTFREDRRYDPYATDYFRDEEKRLEGLKGTAPAPGHEEWSEGLLDEANEPEDNPESLLTDETIQSEIIEDFGSAINMDDIIAPDSIISTADDDMLDFEPEELGTEEIMSEQLYETEALSEESYKDIGPHRSNQKCEPGPENGNAQNSEL